MERIKTLYQNKIVRYIFSFIFFLTAYIFAKVFDINPFPEKRISLLGVLAIMIFIYVAVDLIKIIKAENTKKKEK